MSCVLACIAGARSVTTVGHARSLICPLTAQPSSSTALTCTATSMRTRQPRTTRATVTMRLARQALGPRPNARPSRRHRLLGGGVGILSGLEDRSRARTRRAAMQVVVVTVTAAAVAVPVPTLVLTPMLPPTLMLMALVMKRRLPVLGLRHRLDQGLRLGLEQ